MSEQGTEQATEQRKQKARDKGDVVHSRELQSAVAMLAGVLALGISAKRFLYAWSLCYSQSLTLGMRDLQEPLDRPLMQEGLKILLPSLIPVAFVLAGSFGGALLAGVGQSGGMRVNTEALTLKLQRLSPASNLANIFSLRSATRLAKSFLPAAVVVLLGAKALRELVLPMPIMSVLRLPDSLNACLRLAMEAGAVMLAWAVLDYVLERRSWNRKLRMTKQEVRDEMKEMMGNPQVKSRVRQIQNAMRRRRIPADVARASVVITNPTHYAVALQFSFEEMLAPTVLVKGRNRHALRIREEARWAGIPIVENPPLARSLYKNVDEGQAIPYELYSAVAGILAFLYRQAVEDASRARGTTGQGVKPREAAAVSGGAL